MRKLVALMALAALSGCGSKDQTAPKAPAKQEKAPTEKVAFNPAFLNLAGRWRSAPGADGMKPGQYVQLDIASAGDFSMEVREDRDGKVQVLESVSGSSQKNGSSLTATLKSEPKGPVLKGIKNWHAEVNEADKKRMMALKGANGQAFTLTWDQM